MGARLDVEGPRERTRGVAVGLLADHRDVVPDRIASPDALIEDALEQAGVTITREERVAMAARIRASMGRGDAEQASAG